MKEIRYMDYDEALSELDSMAGRLKENSDAIVEISSNMRGAYEGANLVPYNYINQLFDAREMIEYLIRNISEVEDRLRELRGNR